MQQYIVESSTTLQDLASSTTYMAASFTTPLATYHSPYLEVYRIRVDRTKREFNAEIND